MSSLVSSEGEAELTPSASQPSSAVAPSLAHLRLPTSAADPALLPATLRISRVHHPQSFTAAAEQAAGPSSVRGRLATSSSGMTDARDREEDQDEVEAEEEEELGHVHHHFRRALRRLRTGRSGVHLDRRWVWTARPLRLPLGGAMGRCRMARGRGALPRRRGGRESRIVGLRVDAVGRVVVER